MFIDKPMLVFSQKSRWTSWLLWVLHGKWALFLFASPTIQLLLHPSSILFFSHRPPPSDTAWHVLSSFRRVWLFVTPWIAVRQAPLSMGFSRQEYWSGLPCPPPGDLSNLGTEPESPASQADSLTLGHQGSPQTLGFLNLPVLVTDFTGSVLIHHSYPPLQFLASCRDEMACPPPAFSLHLPHLLTLKKCPCRKVLLVTTLWIRC